MDFKKYLLSLISVLVFISIVVMTGCKKDEPGTPDSSNPKFSSISIEGSGTAYTVVVGFNQGVYRTPEKAGDLNDQSFMVSSGKGVATIVSYSVTHSAGQKSASIRVVFDQDANGEEIIEVTPRDANSIFNGDGRAIASSEIRSISTAGIEHQIITVKDDGNGTGTTTWTANNIYILDGLVYVNEGQELTIEAGTVIKGKAGQGEEASALIVARGGKIYAVGTADEPIIFTSESDDLNGSVGDLDSGLWGGVIILGAATLNTIPGEQQIEGIPTTEIRGVYGGNDDNDDSGVFKYVSIRHGGTDIGEGNEINGLTLGGVGSSTVIEFVEVFANKDDGIEIFGGTPRLQHIVAAFCGDDLFDYDQGFRGKGQFWAGVQGFNRGDRVGEHDGGTEPEDGQPYANPDIFNATYVGLPTGAGRRVITFRDNAGGHYANSIFYQQAFGIDIELLKTTSSYNRFEEGELSVKNNMFHLVDDTALIRVAAGDGVSDSEANEANAVLSNYFTEANNEIKDPGFTLDGLTFDIIPSKNVSENLAEYPADGWMKTVSYKGAFDPNENWAEGWTLFSKYMN